MKCNPQSVASFSLSSGLKVVVTNFLQHIINPKNLRILFIFNLIQEESDELELKYENIRV
jgi:hypothetical protein